MALGGEYHDIEKRLSIPQAQVMRRLEGLWAAVEQAEKAKFLNISPENLPHNIQQRYFALETMMREIIIHMLSSSEVPDEVNILSEIRERTMSLIKEIQAYDSDLV